MKSLILLHGALGCSEQFNQLYSLLQDKYEVYKFDFSGHGKNSDNVEFTIDRFTDDLHAFIKDREIQSTAIFGYSMGGYVALNLALKHADHIQKIITFGTKFDWNPEVAENEIRKLDPKKISEKVPAFAQRLAELHGEARWQTVVRNTADMMNGLGNGSGLTDFDFRQIKTPVLICRGELDSMVTRSESEHVAALIENGNYMEISGFKHPIEAIDHNQLAGMITNWI